jgi:hypothetical protein
MSSSTPLDLSFSNSLIEAWWRCLKHQWLYLHTLDNLAVVRKLVAFYVTEYDLTMPHSAFYGQTPDDTESGIDLRARSIAPSSLMR